MLDPDDDRKGPVPMILFMTSSPCDDNVPAGAQLPCIFFEKNAFVQNLRDHWKPDARLVVVCSDPYNDPLNDEMCDTFTKCFRYHGMTVSSSILLDGRNARDAARIIALSDVVLLGGGHVPTQNAFFERIGLRALLREYTGVIMGVSAGSMNCTDTVYCQPELPGESVDPDFRRFIPGLGLSSIQILPHYQMVRDNVLDGKRLYEDITYGDSFGRSFYALVDGSYVMRINGHDTLFGEGYLIRDGKISQICREGEHIALEEAL
ncbi:MAG: Type 1 glutamine amidotransferase-like domain-containing protein [Clostridia bacterium]|nr:Type 1 glutamine amidotransferase-like domain-containing protein [Clostridia bacterium]